MSRRALVIGGSMGGLFAALALLRRGWDVEVFERSGQALAGRGAGIVTHGRLLDAMQAVGLDTGSGLGVPIEERVVLDAGDGEVAHLRYPQVATSWDRLFTLLREAFPAARYRLGRDLAGVEQDGRLVRAHFADGGVEAADLLVGADGFRSAVRDAMLGVIRPTYAGYIAWRGLAAEADIPPDAHRAIFGRFAFCLPPGEQVLGYPVAGPGNDLRPGHRRYNLVWYRPADEHAALPGLLTDATGHRHALSIPPPLIRPEFVASLRQAAAGLAPALAAVVAATPSPFLQPIYDLESPSLAVGRVALVGDAGFVVRPHVGAGVTKAAEDALALAACVEDADIPAALQRYDATRRPEGQKIVRRARHLGAYLQAQVSTEEERAAAARHTSPGAVLAETAQLDF